MAKPDLIAANRARDARNMTAQQEAAREAGLDWNPIYGGRLREIQAMVNACGSFEEIKAGLRRMVTDQPDPAMRQRMAREMFASHVLGRARTPLEG